MSDDFEALTDHQNRVIRLTNERWSHILKHPEMIGQEERLIETLANPEMVIATDKDKTVRAYHRLYDQSPVTRKYMIVAVKFLVEDAFVVTAFYSSRKKKGEVVWTP